MRPTPQLPSLEVYMLGLVDFLEVQQLQRRIVYELGEQGGAALIFASTRPRSAWAAPAVVLTSSPTIDMLQAMGIRVHWVNRGGGCVLHLPGQLAAYFALPLDELGLNLQGYLDRLHTAILKVLGEFDLTGSLRADLPGVFSGPARIATVGVAVSRSIAYHGSDTQRRAVPRVFRRASRTGDRRVPPAVYFDGVTAAAAYGDAQGA